MADGLGLEVSDVEDAILEGSQVGHYINHRSVDTILPCCDLHTSFFFLFEKGVSYVKSKKREE